MGVVPALTRKHSVLCLFPSDFCLSRVLWVSLQVDGGQRDAVTETTACVCTQCRRVCVRSASRPSGPHAWDVHRAPFTLPLTTHALRTQSG